MFYAYIILFQDGTIQVYPYRQSLDHFQEGARQFKTPAQTNIIELCEFASKNFESNRYFEELD